MRNIKKEHVALSLLFLFIVTVTIASLLVVFGIFFAALGITKGVDWQ